MAGSTMKFIQIQHYSNTNFFYRAVQGISYQNSIPGLGKSGISLIKDEISLFFSFSI
jgi:hypothetical protein